MAAAFDFDKFLENSTKIWKKQALKEKYCIQNEFTLDKEVICLGIRMVNWKKSTVDSCIKNIQKCLMSSRSSSKSSSSAEESRQKGNKLFQKKDYRGALQCYTKSVQLAPHDGTDILALAHANRSAALFHLGQYKTCMQDIDEAIAQGYPTDKRFKVLQRKGQCLMKLEFIEKAQKEFEKALQCFDRFNRGEDKKRQEILALLRDSYSPAYNICVPDYDPVETPEEVKEMSSSLPNASSAVTCKHQKGKGRYLEPTRDIAMGELLIKEKPYAAIVLKQEEDSHCHYCFVQCSPIPCPNCTYARYCSLECRTNCWSRYHSLECGAEELLQQVSIFSQLSLRILITAGKEALSSHIRKPKTSSSPSSPPSTSASTSTLTSASTSSTAAKALSSSPVDGSLVDYEAIAGLEAHWFNHSHEELLQYAVTAILLAKCFCRELVAPETLETLSEEELITEIASLLLLHIRQLKSNSHAITEVRSSDGENTAVKLAGGTVQDISQVRVATAIYPTVSLMNHACQPNVFASFNKGTISVRAMEHILRGDEILHCYGPQVGHMTTSDRQQALLAQYCFTCHCRACTSKNEIRDRKLKSHLKCPRCSHPIEIDTSWCVKCSQKYNMAVLLKEATGALNRIHELRGMYSAAQKDEALMKDVVSKTKSCIKVLDHILVPPDIPLAESYDFLARCYVTLEEYKEAGSWLAKSIPTVEWQYGRDSIEVANELHKLAQIYFNGEEVKPAMETIDRALELFTRHYGNSNDEVMELMKMKACLMTL